MNETDLPWEDLRTVLAVARAGGLAAAGRSLGVSHATAFRRLRAIERRLGVALFERHREGYRPTPAGEDLAATAARVEAEVAGVTRRIAGRDLRPAGAVRVTTTDTLLVGLLTPVFAAFAAEHPAIDLDITMSNHLFDPSRREADVAIRPTAAPPEGLVGTRIGTIAQAVYGPAGGAGGARLAEAAWVGPEERLSYRPLIDWMAASGADRRCRYRVDSLMGMHAAVRAGIGIAVLPCYLCDGDPALARVAPPIPALATDLWLLTHPDLRRVARIRAFLEGVAAAVRARRGRLAGDGAGDALRDDAR